MQPLSRLTNEELRTLAAELRSGRLHGDPGGLALVRWLDRDRAGPVSEWFQSLAMEGFTGHQAALLLEHLLADRQHVTDAEIDTFLELVTTGPEASGASSRSTAAVVQSLFASAAESVDVVGYAVYQGRSVFRVLAERMQQSPHLRVRMFLNVGRQPGDTSASSEIVKRFLHRFRTQDWPESAPLPELYYDPRALDAEGRTRASLHAKCVVVDSQSVFISSANFTEAAHERNIEIGLTLVLPVLARRLQGFLDRLIAQDNLTRITASRT